MLEKCHFQAELILFQSIYSMCKRQFVLQIVLCSLIKYYVHINKFLYVCSLFYLLSLTLPILFLQFKNLIRKKEIVLKDKASIVEVIKNLDEQTKIALRHACQQVNTVSLFLVLCNVVFYYVYFIMATIMIELIDNKFKCTSNKFKIFVQGVNANSYYSVNKTMYKGLLKQTDGKIPIMVKNVALIMCTPPKYIYVIRFY